MSTNLYMYVLEIQVLTCLSNLLIEIREAGFFWVWAGVSGVIHIQWGQQTNPTPVNAGVICLGSPPSLTAVVQAAGERAQPFPFFIDFQQGKRMAAHSHALVRSGRMGNRQKSIEVAGQRDPTYLFDLGVSLVLAHTLAAISSSYLPYSLLGILHL